MTRTFGFDPAMISQRSEFCEAGEFLNERKFRNERANCDLRFDVLTRVSFFSKGE